jgi:gamma-glutamyl-gamma-aminobutyrate hydrolase PuuD
VLEYVWDHPQVRPIARAAVLRGLPTTSGTGSEVGRSSVVSENDTHIKRTVFSPKILARAVFADPELTLALPPAVTAATGMDALTHNIESYLSPAWHPMCDGIALEGLRLGARALVTAVKDPGNLQARADMMMSSLMGAVAFQKDLGGVHACAHALGAVADLHHGLANALMIDTVLHWNHEAVPEKFDELAHAAGVPGGGFAFVTWLKHLKQQIGIQGGLAAHGVTEAMLPRMVPLAEADFTNGTNPRKATAADYERLFRRRCDMMADKPLLIGVSARIYYPGSQGALPGVFTKTLHYLEQSVAHWVLSGHAMAVMIPAVTRDSIVLRSDLALDDYAQALDGLVLQGGNDVAPECYGEAPLKPEWAGDPVRDKYEIELINAFINAGKPVFGVCRGFQLLNVMFGGTLWQDIATPATGIAGPPRDRPLREALPPGRVRARHAAGAAVPGPARTVANSIHHQGIKDLAPGFVVEARCPDDGMVEAIRRTTPGAYVAGVQWHPEFHDPTDTSTIDDAPMLQDFLDACRAARSKG